MKRINLIPEEAKRVTAAKWVKSFFLKSRLSRLSVLAAAVFVIFNIYQTGSLLRYKVVISLGKKQVNQMLEKLSAAQDDSAKIKIQAEQVARQEKYTQDKLDVLLAARTERIAWAGTLERISRLLPENLWVNKVIMNKQLITIAGTTFDNEVVGKFMSGLDESGYFRQTSFNYTKKSDMAGQAVIDFEVTTHLVLDKAVR